MLSTTRLAAVDAAVAADTLHLRDVTVTAIKQGGNASATASTAITRRQAERNDVAGAKTAAALVPNFFIPDYGSRMTSTIYVRGLGTRIDQPSVGLNVDNVPIMCKENYDMDLMDVARIEMLRGPQSTLYGRNTMGGLMNIYTLSPSQWQGTRALITYGSRNLYKVGLSHYTRPSDKLALSVSAYYTGTDGEFRNRYNDRLLDWERQGSGRFKLEWRPVPSLLVNNVFAATASRQGGYPYEQVGTGMIAYNDTCFYRRTSVTDGLTITKLWDRATLSSITSYQYIDDNMTLDQDFTTLPYFTLTQARHEHAVTQDLVLRGDRHNSYRWMGGLFGFYRHMNMNAPVTFKDTGIASLIEQHVNDALPAYPVRWDTRSFVLGSDFTMPTWGAALYHQSELDWNRFTFTAALRIDYEHATLNYHSETHTGYDIIQAATGTVYRHEPIDIDDRGTLKKDFVQFMPRFTVTYRLNDASDRIYLSVARGSKAGGFNTQMFSDVLQQRLMRMMGIGTAYNVNDVVGYRPEKSWNYELGTHLEAWSGRFSLDADVFYMDCRDRQLTIFPAGLTTGRMMTNAGQTRSYGAEVSMTLRPTLHTSINASYGYTHATFAHYDDGKADYSGRHVPYAPSHTLWAEALHEFNLGSSDWAQSLTVAANVSGAGRIYWNEANTLHQPFYALMGANITLAGKHYSLQLWGRNLTGTNYRTFYFVSIGHEFLQRGHGRTLGATLRLQF